MLRRIGEGEIDKRVEEWDRSKWIESMNSKSTLQVYRSYKQELKEENFYDNAAESIIMFKARSNSLKLKWRSRFQNESVVCVLCGEEEENLQHFLIRCPALQHVRVNNAVEGLRLEELLLFEGDHDVERCKRHLSNMWREKK